MSNEPIPCPTCGQFCGDQFDQTCDELRALVAQPAEQSKAGVELDRITSAYRAELDELAQRNYDLRFKLSEQHQGEPVAYLVRSPQTKKSSSVPGQQTSSDGVLD